MIGDETGTLAYGVEAKLFTLPCGVSRWQSQQYRSSSSIILLALIARSEIG